MKKTQLTKIIEEEIQKLQEQLTVSGPELLNSFATWNQQNGSPVDWRCRPDMRSWLVSVFNLPNFNSTNPNQPCTFIQNKITQITAWIAAFTGNPNSSQLAMKQCKLQVFQSMLPWAQGFFNC